MSWENIQDYDAFTSAVQNELLKRVVDLENQQLVYGTGGTTQLSGLTTTAGILTYPAVGTQENFTDIATAIAALRTGPALAEPDLLLLHPDT
jgi:HK97 family phage major capsid protein